MVRVDPKTLVNRFQSLNMGVQHWQQIHAPEYLSTLGLKEFLETVPEGTVVQIDF